MSTTHDRKLLKKESWKVARSKTCYTPCRYLLGTSYSVGTSDREVKDVSVADLFVRTSVCEFFLFPWKSFPPSSPPALQPSAAWLMFTQWLIWLFWVTLAQQQVISTISTSRLRGTCALREDNLAPRLESRKQRAQRWRVFTPPLIYALSAAEPRVLFLLSSCFPPSLPPHSPLLPFHLFLCLLVFFPLLPFPSISLLSFFFFFCPLFQHLRSPGDWKYSSHLYNTSGWVPNLRRGVKQRLQPLTAPLSFFSLCSAVRGHQPTIFLPLPLSDRTIIDSPPYRGHMTQNNFCSSETGKHYYVEGDIKKWHFEQTEQRGWYTWQKLSSPLALFILVFLPLCPLLSLNVTLWPSVFSLSLAPDHQHPHPTHTHDAWVRDHG